MTSEQVESEISLKINRNVYIIRLLIVFVITYLFGDYLLFGMTGVMYTYFPLTFYYNQTGILFLKNVYMLTQNVSSNFTSYYNYTGVLFLNKTYVLLFGSHYLYPGTVEQFLFDRLLLL